MRKFLVVSLTAILLSAGPAMAKDEHKGSHRHDDSHHRAHLHGEGQLNIAVDGGTVEMELIVPADDLIGFEHQPESQQDKAALARANAILQDGGALFVLNAAAAGCILSEAELEPPSFTQDHAEFHAHYHFACAKPDRLEGLSTGYFTHFPRAQVLNVNLISHNGQTKAELTASAPRLAF